MSTTTTKNIIPLIANYFVSQPVKKAWLFGSYARGEENKDSDVDILVQLDYSQPIGMKYFSMICDLESKLGKKVDLVDEKGLLSFARPYVDNDKILLYERAD